MEEYKEYSLDEFLDLILVVDIERTNLIENIHECTLALKSLEETRSYLISKMKEEYTNNAQ